MPGLITPKYIASVAMTVTNLHSLASSQDWLTGWSSASVVNTTNNYSDYLISGTFTTHATNRQAGTINVYVVASLNDTPLWPASATGTPGTEGALSFIDTEERDTIVAPLWSIAVDNTASAVYSFAQKGIAHLFGGRVPTHFAIYASQNCGTTTTAGLAAAGSAIYYTPIQDQYT